MTQFINKEISESELFELTPLNINYEAIYLCSAFIFRISQRTALNRFDFQLV